MRYYVCNEKELNRVKNWVRNKSFVVFDIETGPSEDNIKEWENNQKVGLDPYRNTIITFQIGDKDTQWIIDNRCGLNIRFLLDILENEEIIKLGANIKFDAKMMMKNFNIVPRSLADIMIIEQIIRCGIFPGKQDESDTSSARIALKYTKMSALAKRYLNLDIDKDEDLRVNLWKTSINEYDDRQLDYMAGDCVYPHLILEKQKPLIISKGLSTIVNLEHKLIPVIADMELTGIPFNREYWISLIQGNYKARADIIQTLNVFLDRKSYKQNDLFSEGTQINELNLDSTKQLARALHDAGFQGFVQSNGEILSTATPRLKLMKIEGLLPEELVDALIEYRKIEKKITSYGKNILKSVNNETKRIHPDFTQTILVTGRMSCSPGMQTIPKDETYRKAFNSPDGYTLIVLDASQIEARVSADITGDKPAIEVFQRNGDIYKEDGEAFYNTKIDKTTAEGKELRNRAKISWLGLSYGQGKEKFHNYCRLFLGEDIPRHDTDFLYNKFFEIHWKMKEVMDEWSSLVDPINSDRYILDSVTKEFISEEQARPVLVKNLSMRPWYSAEKVEELATKLLKNKERVRYSETLLGRKRFFRVDYVGWWTAGRNHPIQGCAADIQKATMLAFQELHWKENFDAHIINVVHDEIITLVKEDQAENLFYKQVKLGEETGQKFLTHVPMKVDGGITKVWKKF